MVRTHAQLLVALTLVTLGGCGDDGKHKKQPDGSETTPVLDTANFEFTYTPTLGTGCGHTVLSEHPAADADDVYYRTTVEVTVSEVDPDATLTVYKFFTPIDGSQVWRDDTLVFTPSEPLSPRTPYNMVLNWCAGSHHWAWRTSDVGYPVVPNEDLTAHTYEIDLVAGRWLAPSSSWGALLDEMRGGLKLLIAPTMQAVGSLEWRLGLVAEDGTQDPCVETVGLTSDFQSDPYFSVNVPSLSFSTAGVPMTLKELRLSGAFMFDGSYLDGIELRAQFDARDLVGVFDGSSPEEVCAFVSATGTSCTACSDGEPLCIDVHIDSMHGADVPISLQERTHSDISSDPACAYG